MFVLVYPKLKLALGKKTCFFSVKYKKNLESLNVPYPNIKMQDGRLLHNSRNAWFSYTSDCLCLFKSIRTKVLNII